VGSGTGARLEPGAPSGGASVYREGSTGQEIDVVRVSVLAIRQGAYRYAEVRGLDAHGEAVYVQGKPEVGPGKQDR
jgi:hypothetical protein